MKCIGKVMMYDSTGSKVIDRFSIIRVSDKTAAKLTSNQKDFPWIYVGKALWKDNGRNYNHNLR